MCLLRNAAYGLVAAFRKLLTAKQFGIASGKRGIDGDQNGRGVRATDLQAVADYLDRPLVRQHPHPSGKPHAGFPVTMLALPGVSGKCDRISRGGHRPLRRIGVRQFHGECEGAGFPGGQTCHQYLVRIGSEDFPADAVIAIGERYRGDALIDIQHPAIVSRPP